MKQLGHESMQSIDAVVQGTHAGDHQQVMVVPDLEDRGKQIQKFSTQSTAPYSASAAFEEVAARGCVSTVKTLYMLRHLTGTAAC